DESAQQGKMFIDGEEALSFLTQPVMSGGFGFRVVTGARNIIVDDVYVSQIDGSGNETVVLDDDFERSDLGADWVNETLGTITDPSALDAYIENGQLVLLNDGSADTWLRTDAQLEFAGKKTIFEYTFVDFVEGSAYLPSPVLGVKPYESGVTNGSILVDAGSFNYGMVDGGWAGGQGSLLGGNRPGMRFKIVVNPGGQSAVIYRDGIEALDFLNIGPAFTGSFAFRTIVDRDAVIDDVRIYTIEDDGSETTLFEDDFNRDDIGDDWITESITPDVAPGAQWSLLEDRDGDGDNELFLDHDASADDAWFRLIRDLPFSGDKPVVIEGTYVDYAGNPAVAIGAVEWIANETVGPILLDNLQTPWVMDTREGNVWVRPGAVAGSAISLKVNADGRSGSFMVNGIKIHDWEFAEGEAPIPAGAVGFEDPFTTPQENTSPPAIAGTFAHARYDDVRVTKLETSSIQDWMIQ
ncbi:hypothetical protein K8I31_18000, partial [bacterium]|nr:hypothetical protein [bacterium]